MRDLCMAGGVALNCVGNGRIQREGPFEQIWIQPAAGDAGGALGVALSLWHRYLGQAARQRRSAGTWERPARRPATVRRAAVRRRHAGLVPRPALHRRRDRALGSRATAIRRDRVERGCARRARSPRCSPTSKVVGLVQGRMEFGPRALGGRSIIGDARSPKMQSVMNLKIKFRESFRPFAPAVLREHVADWFELDGDSPYMLLVADVVKPRRLPDAAGGEQALWGIEKLNVPRSTVPAITHVDYSARVQTVRRDTNPLYLRHHRRRSTAAPAVR